MTISKHTQGDWFFEKIDRWPFGAKIVTTTGLVILQQDAYCSSTVQKTREDNEAGVGFSYKNGQREYAAAKIAEQDANIRLWTAAPKLLKALHQIIEVRDERDKVLMIAQLAINEAEGKQ